MKIPNYIKNNLLFKVTSANTFLVLVRMGFTLISQKVLAVIIGAEGIALVGNLKNVLKFLEQFSILGTSNGLVKYIAEYKDDKQQLNYLYSTAFVFAAFASLCSFLVLFFFSESLNELIFGSNFNYSYIFKILAFIVPFLGINAIIYSILNGYSAYKLYTKVTFASIVISTIVIVSLTYYYDLNGSLLAICLIPIIHFLLYLIFFSKTYKNYLNIEKLTFNLSFKNKLLSYSFMMLVVVLFVNINDVAIRDLIKRNINISEAGNWTAMTSISKTYMQFLAAIFPLYILPRYAKINNTFEFRSEVKKIYKMLLPLIILGMVMVFLSRTLIIKLLYTNEFLSISSMFKWQLLGDFVKFIAIVLSYQFLAKKQIGYYVFTELLSVVLFYGFSVYYIEIYGTDGIVIAHFVRYILYFLVVLFILRHTLIGKNKTI